jgi:hypothetical protein
VLNQHFAALEHICRSAVICGWSRTGLIASDNEKTSTRIMLSARNGRSLLVITSAASLNNPSDPTPEAHRVFDKVRELGFENTLASHRKGWHSFWDRSFIHAVSDSGDAEMIAEHWAWTMYIMGSSSRGILPAKFNGMIWGTEGDKRRWGSLYWWWNTQIIYRPLIAANHGELMKPLFDMYARILEPARIAARQQWASKGIFLPETTSFDGLEKLPENIASELQQFLLGNKTLDQTTEEFREFTSARNGYDSRYNWLHKRSTAPYSWVTHIFFSGAQIAWHHWLYWEYTQDKEFLRTRAYPLIRGVAEFYRNFPNLKLGKDGLYHLHRVNDQELLWGVRDPHNEIWAMQGIFATAIAASKILNVDADMRPKWQNLIDHLAPPPLSTDLDVVKGCFFPHPSGRPVWALGRNPVRHIEGLESDNIVRPCVDYDIWTLESTNKAMTQIAHDTFDTEPARNRAHEGKYAYDLTEIPLMAAALGRADDVRVILPTQLKHKRLPNRLSLEDGEQNQSIEPIATVATATQWALIQSIPPATGQDPVIRLFPAWPREWDVTFELLARRGFKVSAALRSEKVHFVEIYSQLGGLCRLRNPYDTDTVIIHSSGAQPRILQGSLLSFDTKSTQCVVLLPKGIPISDRRLNVP